MANMCIYVTNESNIEYLISRGTKCASNEISLISKRITIEADVR